MLITFLFLDLQAATLIFSFYKEPPLYSLNNVDQLPLPAVKGRKGAFFLFFVKLRRFYLGKIHSDYITLEKENNITLTKTEFYPTYKLTFDGLIFSMSY